MAEIKNRNNISNNEEKLRYSFRNTGAGILFGIGVAAFIDETVFHQLLHWHHFYDKSTTNAGLVSDGFFHAFSWFATVAALFLVADLRRRHAFWPVKWWGAVLIGAGGFQLYDGTIQHKLMRIHQIRYVEDLLPYDLVWNGSAVLMIIAGSIILYKNRNRNSISGGRR
ncbi:Uncharacterized membrane protein [Halobacillus alkaliphilus]|uniref:Uncharacterized membrane protein n=1 Tax=Halobacillus alkaliphilus TaxID=396056 RepID=A0A1I2JPW9_9BACI|nr:Uncharacterized membrane protein [Halobacillus alkaliphilus]